MRYLDNLSIGRKQTLIMMLTSAITLLLASAAFIAAESLNFRGELMAEISTLAEIAGNNCAAALDFNQPKDAVDTLAALRAKPPIAEACVYNRQGDVFAAYHRDGKSTLAHFPPVQSAGHEFRGNQLQVFLPIIEHGDKVGTIFVSCDLYELSDRLKGIAAITAIVLGLSLLAAFALSLRLQRVVSGPVLQLAQAVRTVAAEKEYSVRAIKQSDDELGQLVDGFNEMLGQIQERDAALLKAQTELEARVAMRTLELATTNKSLHLENIQRKKAEETLRESEEKFRQLADNISDLFWVCSPDLAIIHYVNPAYEQIWGRSVASLYADPHQWSQAILPEERARVLAAFALIMGNEPSMSVQFQIIRPDGAIRWIHSRGFQVRNAAGRLLRLAGIASDITEHKKIEGHLLQSQKMETVGKLAGGIAHEFNSIMTAIIGHSELLLIDLPPGSPLIKSAQEIRVAADRAAVLTRQLLAYGRKQILQPEILNLNSILSSMENVLRHLAGNNGNISLILGPGLKMVKADASQIEQVIVNIAMNATEAMPNGGTLSLETANATLDEDYAGRFPDLKPGEYVMLAITDTGIGMSEAVRARVFEPFFSTKGVGQGVGLGLATCYGIVKQSGGHISVYSEQARGTTFKIYLPQVDAPVKIPVRTIHAPDLPRGTETILLVEDDPALREMAATLLTRLGYSVWAAANGVEALSLQQQRGAGHVDLLFTDVVMPHMSGKELADRVRVLFPHTKILFTSAYTENAIVHQGVLDPGVSLLQKPFTPTALANKIRDVLDRGNGKAER